MKNKSFTFTLVIAVLVVTSTSYAWGMGIYGYSGEDPDRVYSCYPNGAYPGSQWYMKNCRRMAGHGFYGMNPEYRGMAIYSWLTTEQQNKLNTLRQKFIDETDPARSKLNKERIELEKEMVSSMPDRHKIKLLIRKISGLKEELMEKTINFRLDVKKIAPFLYRRNINRRCYSRMHGLIPENSF